MRKLASIQEVKDVFVHSNADALELAKINGWICVVKKEEFKPGDLGVYFEIDSFLPASDVRFSFLEKTFRTFEDTLGARIRTIRLRGELSQGLILPLTAFPELEGFQVGDDVTEILGVKKYEKPLPISSQAKGHFPSFIEKTDQERIQNLQHFDTSGEWEETEKLDGSSLTIYLNEEEFGVCSRNLELKFTENDPMWMVAIRLRLEEKLRSLGKNIALQGEIVGPKIQDNRYKFSTYEFFVYDVYDIDFKRKLLPHERYEIINALNMLGDETIKTVPNNGYIILPQGENWMEELLLKADGTSLLHNETLREGFVYKHKEKNISFKVISNKFLLKYED